MINYTPKNSFFNSRKFYWQQCCRDISVIWGISVYFFSCESKKFRLSFSLFQDGKYPSVEEILFIFSPLHKEKFPLFEETSVLFVSCIWGIFSRYLKKCTLYLFVLHAGKFLLFEEATISLFPLKAVIIVQIEENCFLLIYQGDNFSQSLKSQNFTLAHGEI